jgi:hypothetical protein
MTADDIKLGLTKALTLAQEGITIDDLAIMLNNGEALLWTGESAALVTTLHTSDHHRFLHVWLGCGDIKELVSFEPGISAWARARGCHYATINGRKGWSRVFKQLGFHEADGELRKNYV